VQALPEWQTLLAVQVGTAATLTGLVFVAVSINLARIREIPGLAWSRFNNSFGSSSPVLAGAGLPLLFRVGGLEFLGLLVEILR